MTELTQNQKKYLMLLTEQARRLRNAAEEIQRSIAEDTLAALEPDADAWPGIPGADVFQRLQEAHAKLDLLTSQLGMFFAPVFDATAAEMTERRRLVGEALAGTWKP